jgi:hypothetical protein
VNRRQRRSTAIPEAVAIFAAAYRCPDCLSESAAPTQDHFGMWHLEIRHDDTCPAYRQMKARGLAR